MLRLLITTMVVFGIWSCQPKEGLDDVPIVGTWNLMHLSGGFAGLNCTMSKGELTWTFYDDGKLIIEDVRNGNDICTGHAEGEYQYTLTEASDGRTFLNIDGSEIGLLDYADSTFTLDQNTFSNGQGADGFYFEFMR